MPLLPALSLVYRVSSRPARANTETLSKKNKENNTKPPPVLVFMNEEADKLPANWHPCDFVVKLKQYLTLVCVRERDIFVGKNKKNKNQKTTKARYGGFCYTTPLVVAEAAGFHVSLRLALGTV